MKSFPSQVESACLFTFEAFGGQRLLFLTGLARLLLEVCLRAKQSHGDGVILSHMQTLSHSVELTVFSTSNLVTHLRMNMMLCYTQINM